PRGAAGPAAVRLPAAREPFGRTPPIVSQPLPPGRQPLPPAEARPRQRCGWCARAGGRGAAGGPWARRRPRADLPGAPAPSGEPRQAEAASGGRAAASARPRGRRHADEARRGAPGPRVAPCARGQPQRCRCSAEGPAAADPRRSGRAGLAAHLAAPGDRPSERLARSTDHLLTATSRAEFSRSMSSLRATKSIHFHCSCPGPSWAQERCTCLPG
ncbi:unnamed protein product, partial [Prorocentrum cordatum]